MALKELFYCRLPIRHAARAWWMIEMSQTDEGASIEAIGETEQWQVMSTDGVCNWPGQIERRWRLVLRGITSADVVDGVINSGLKAGAF
jgi:hypothetical protein